MVMVGQNRRLREPLRWTRAGKITVAAAGAIVAAAVIALVVAISSGTPAKRPGCIAVTFASSVGGATVEACGAKARSDCADPQGSSLAADAGALRVECRRAKLPYEATSG